MELNTARVFVRDIVEAKHFYGSTMGLPIKADGVQYGYCVFRAGAADLVVESVSADAPAEEQALVGRFTGLSFSVPDVLATHRDLLSRGVEFTEEPERQAWGGILATFRDPARNEIQIVQHAAD